MTASTLTIAPMTRSHLRAVVAIDARVHPRPWSRRLWLAELDRSGRHYRCALDGRRVVGYVGAMFVVEDAHVLTLATHPDHHRRGIATRLMVDLVGEAIGRGAEALTLEVRAGNTAAQELYRRFGLAPVGWRRNYYAPEGEDAIVMWAHDIQGDAYRQRIDQIAVGIEVAA